MHKVVRFDHHPERNEPSEPRTQTRHEYRRVKIRVHDRCFVRYRRRGERVSTRRRNTTPRRFDSGRTRAFASFFPIVMCCLFLCACVCALSPFLSLSLTLSSEYSSQSTAGECVCRKQRVDLSAVQASRRLCERRSLFDAPFCLLIRVGHPKSGDDAFLHWIRKRERYTPLTRALLLHFGRRRRRRRRRRISFPLLFP